MFNASHRLALAGTVCLGLTLGLEPRARASESQIEFDLMPPKLQAGSKLACKPVQSGDDLTKIWAAWDGKSKPKTAPGAMREQAQRLAATDPVKNFPVSEKILRYLMKSSDAKLAAAAGIDVVRLYVDADRLTKDNAGELMPLLQEGRAARSPNSLYIQGQIHERGYAVARDEAKAIGFYKAAARFNHPDALLRLASYKAEGKLPGDTLDPKFLTALAFNRILAGGATDICSRIKRIARAYAKGDSIVKPNHTVASAWLQLAADLGDADAAWSVAKYHLRSELLVKDNAVLKRYMLLAADGGVVQAMLEAGRLHQDGTLFAKDLAKAEALYRAAAAKGSLTAWARLAELYEREWPDGSHATEREAALRAIAADPLAPAASLVELADIELTTRGRVAGEAPARALLMRAAATQNSDAAIALAKLDLINRHDILRVPVSVDSNLRRLHEGVPDEEDPGKFAAR